MKRSANAAKRERRKSWVDPLFRWERDTRPKKVWDPVLGTGYHLQRTGKHVVLLRGHVEPKARTAPMHSARSREGAAACTAAVPR